MRRIAALCLIVGLAGCVITPATLKSDTLAYGEVIEETTNKLLVLNLLRARDKAPLHFADVPVLRESMQQSFSFTLLDFFGTSRAASSTRDSAALGTSVQKTPSFDMNQLHSKDFITGITSPIDPKIVKYWLDRGLDRRLVLLLFFSGVEIIETHAEGGPVTTIRISNSPREAVEIIKTRTVAPVASESLLCDRQSDFERYLKLLNKVRTFFAHSYRERRLLARDVQAGNPENSRNLQAFAALDQSKVQLHYNPERGTYNVYSLSAEHKIAFCFYDPTRSFAPASAQYEFIDSGRDSGSDRRNCFQAVVEVGIEDPARRIAPTPIFFPGAQAAQQESRYCSIYNRFSGSTAAPPPSASGYPKRELRLFIRSVGEIFQFLGDLLYYQEELRRHFENHPQPGIKLNTPVTFGFCPDQPEPGCNDVFLRLDADPCNARFTLTYRERDYSVGNYDPPGSNARRDSRCHPDPETRKDHTIEVLAVLHQLVGLNKAATDVRATPTVQVLP